MTLLQSIILGIVQGLTEFLPISSSAHLVLVPYLFGWEIPAEQAFIFDVLVQVATLVAVIAYFWKDLIAHRARLSGGPAAAQALSRAIQRAWAGSSSWPPSRPACSACCSRTWSKPAFASPLARRRLPAGHRRSAGGRRAARQAQRADLEALNWIDALWIGFFQAIAIFPGVSRSGATITGGMMRDLRPARRGALLFPDVHPDHAGSRSARQARPAADAQLRRAAAGVHPRLHRRRSHRLPLHPLAVGLPGTALTLRFRRLLRFAGFDSFWG